MQKLSHKIKDKNKSHVTFYQTGLSILSRKLDLVRIEKLVDSGSCFSGQTLRINVREISRTLPEVKINVTYEDDDFIHHYRCARNSLKRALPKRSKKGKFHE